MSKRFEFQLGEQPKWCGDEECGRVPSGFVGELLNERGVEGLIERGYAVLELPPKISALYSQFHEAFEAFSHLPMKEKERFATTQFDSAKHSPNQFHGFSIVSGLKEQFMMRLCGSDMQLVTPGRYPTCTATNSEQTLSPDLGVVGMQLYEQLDRLCRKVLYQVAASSDFSSQLIDKILDPCYELDKDVVRDPNNDLVCYSSYVFPKFISSSIMDNFHYYNTFHQEATEEKNTTQSGSERFVNNHAAHTDSGILTVVVVTDVPGLEVYDQKLNAWIALEKLLHEYFATTTPKRNHRCYCTVFWGDSCNYLLSSSKKTFKPCLHRVEKANVERYSVVFKQRTAPLATAPRYQEDYELALTQLKAMDAAAAKGLLQRKS